jgi:hypothetical protein
MQNDMSELLDALHDAPGIDERTFYAAIEVLQEYTDYLEWLEENMPAPTTAIVTVIEGTGVRFKDIDAFADFVAQRMMKR